MSQGSSEASPSRTGEICTALDALIAEGDQLVRQMALSPVMGGLALIGIELNIRAASWRDKTATYISVIAPGAERRFLDVGGATSPLAVTDQYLQYLSNLRDFRNRYVAEHTSAPQADVVNEVLNVVLRDGGKHICAWSPGDGMFLILANVTIASRMRQRQCAIQVQLQIRLASGGLLEPHPATVLPDDILARLRRYPELAMGPALPSSIIHLDPGKGQSSHVVFFFPEIEWKRWGELDMLARDHVTLRAYDVVTHEVEGLVIDSDPRLWLGLPLN